MISARGLGAESPPRRIAIYLAAALLAVSMSYVSARALWQGAGRDATTFYFGTRLLLQGDNPYDPARLHAEWERSRLAGNTQTAPPPFVNPPSIGVLVAPAAPFSFAPAMFVFVLLNLTCLFGSVFLLDRMFLAGSSPVTRLLLASWVVLMPPVMKVLSYGQSALLICAPTALALYCLRRRRDLFAGFFLALTFAKFTITLPLLAVLILHGRWKAAISSVVIFGFLNLALVLPFGLGRFLESYRGAIAELDSVNGVNDPLSSLAWEPYNIVSCKRFFFLFFGDDRTTVTLAVWLFTALVVVLFVVLVRKSTKRSEAFEDPLELGIAIMVGMALMYHRVYDLAVLMFVIYPLVQYRRNNPGVSSTLWKITLGTVFILSFFVVGTGWSKPLDFFLTKLHLLASPNYGAPLVVVLLAELMILSAFNSPRAERVSAFRHSNENPPI